MDKSFSKSDGSLVIRINSQRGRYCGELMSFGFAYIDISLARLSSRHITAATPGAVRVSSKNEFFSSSKAVREPGYSYVPARETLRKAVIWYRANGYAPQPA
jgi:hypothetical protein